MYVEVVLIIIYLSSNLLFLNFLLASDVTCEKHSIPNSEFDNRHELDLYQCYEDAKSPAEIFFQNFS